MKNMKHANKGFTLVEVLIVVVIIAILAALILPRLTSQTDKAKAAEALQMVGAIKRAAEMRYDLKGSYNVPDVTIRSSPGSPTTGDWMALGLQDLAGTTKWTYEYRGFGSTFFDVSAKAGDDELTYSSTFGGQWTCTGVFKYNNPFDPAKGCTAVGGYDLPGPHPE